MSYFQEYPLACDYIREKLGLENNVSLYEMVVRFVEEYKKVTESSKQEKIDDGEPAKRKSGRPRKSN